MKRASTRTHLARIVEVSTIYQVTDRADVFNRPTPPGRIGNDPGSATWAVHETHVDGQCWHSGYELPLCALCNTLYMSHFEGLLPLISTKVKKERGPVTSHPLSAGATLY